MAEYKHWKNLAKNDDYCFVTTVIEEHIPVLAEPRVAHLILSCLDFYRAKYGFFIHAYVVMPDHIHLLLKLVGTVTLQKLMADFKRYTAKEILSYCRDAGRSDWLARFERRGAVDGEVHSVWERSFRSVPVLTEKAGLEKIAYIHRNPVRRELVKVAEEWLYSSASAYDGCPGPFRVDLIR